MSTIRIGAALRLLLQLEKQKAGYTSMEALIQSLLDFWLREKKPETPFPSDPVVPRLAGKVRVKRVKRAQPEHSPACKCFMCKPPREKE